MQKPFATIVFILLIAGAAYWLFKPHELVETTQEPVAMTVPAPVADTPEAEPMAENFNDNIATQIEPAEATDTPPAMAALSEDMIAAPLELEASDAVVLAVVKDLNPDVVAWLLPEEQIRKWVALINLLADGKVPVKNRPLEYPLPPFQVTQEDDSLWLDRNNYRRANTVIRALADMPPSRVARYYTAWLPLLNKAQEELGNGKQFPERVQTAIKHIQAVRTLSGKVELKAGVLKYTFANPELEQATALEKALWRLGPTNTLRIQNYLRNLAPLL